MLQVFQLRFVTFNSISLSSFIAAAGISVQFFISVQYWSLLILFEPLLIELEGAHCRGQNFRKVPTFVTAHTFCASQDTQVSYGWVF